MELIRVKDYKDVLENCKQSFIQSDHPLLTPFDFM